MVARQVPDTKEFLGAEEKVNPVSPNHRFVIALRSPDGVLETGLSMCPPEKRQVRDAVRCRAVRSPQSGSSANNREIRAFFAYFEGRRADFLCTPDCVAEGGGIRTLGTGPNPVKSDVCVSYAELTSFRISPRTGCSPVDTLNGAISRSFVRRSAGDCVAESGHLRSSSRGQIGSHVTACLPRSPRAKIIPAGCARQKANDWRFSEIPARAL